MLTSLWTVFFEVSLIFRNELLVDCFGFNGSFSQYLSLYRAVSRREEERKEMMIGERKIKSTPSAPTASTVGLCPTAIQTALKGRNTVTIARSYPVSVYVSNKNLSRQSYSDALMVWLKSAKN